jgi:adenine specific DNA methylase Mod
VNTHIRALLNEAFGEGQLINELIWQKTRVSKSQSRGFGNVHDTVFLYEKSDSFPFMPQYLPLEKSYQDSHYNLVEEETGRRYGLWDFTQGGQDEPRRFGDKVLRPPPGKHWIWSQDRIDQALKENRTIFTSTGMPRLKRYLDESKGRQIADIWIDVFDVNAVAEERTGDATQKPESLLQRIVNASSREGKLVADFFAALARRSQWRRSSAVDGSAATYLVGQSTSPESVCWTSKTANRSK